MSGKPLSRRAFLAAGGGALLLAACGSSGSDGDGNGGASAGRKTLSAFRMEIEPYQSSAPQRFAFVLVDNERNFAGGPEAELVIAPPGGSFGRPMAASYHDEGLSKGRGVYIVEPVLAEAGNWRGMVSIDGYGDAELAFPVTASPETPILGAPGRSVPSPTTANTLGTDPLCTRTDDASNPAPCAFHAQSLDQVVGKGAPVVAMFATPARCQSRYCGPVLDQLIALMPEYEGRIVPVHVEIFQDLQSNNLVTATEAWLGTTGEPWVFTMDGAGNVTGRLSGAFASDEIRTLLDGTLA
jgi:hypothetical protein